MQPDNRLFDDFVKLVNGAAGTLAGVGDLPVWATGPAILLAIAGTSLAPIVVERMTDHGFRQWTRAIIFVIGAVYLVRAAWLFWQG